MKIQQDQIIDFNKKELENHNDNYNFLTNKLTKQGYNVETIYL